MQKVKFNSKSNVIAQLPSGVESEVVVDDSGVVYIPAFSMPGVIEVTSTSTSSGKSESTNSEESTVSEENSEKTSRRPKPSKTEKTYTEKELQDMDAKTELEPLCSDLGIKIPKEGRNTNKKLRELILKHQESSGTDSASDAEDQEEDLTVSDFEKVFTDLEDEKIDDDEAVAILVSYDVDKSIAKKAIEEFNDDPDLEIEKLASDLFEDNYGVENSEESSKSGQEIPKDEWKNLKPGTEIIADTEEDGEFTAKVVSVKRGKVTIQFEDDQTDFLDDDYYTKVSYK